MKFEDRVRRTAEAVWDLKPGECQPSHYPNDPVVKEIDGIVRLRDLTHLLMVTTSTRLEKIKGDTKKLEAAERIESQTATSVAKWIITEKQLDAEHIEYARKRNVKVISFESFQQRFFNSSKYILRRGAVAFGSARDPVTDSINIAVDAYVDLPITVVFDPDAKEKRNPREISLDEIVSRLVSGGSVVLLAPFGSGKSLTTREIFLRMSRSGEGEAAKPTPLCLNMREHWGEDYSDEILDRHARIIGYDPRSDLVAAWRAGMCCALIDGFDELASQTVVRLDNSNFMREARRSALKGLRDFTQKLPFGTGVFICGRDHYFDTTQELHSSLGTVAERCLIARLGEFDEESARRFLQRNGIGRELPDWLPRKPLLLSYLLRNNLFDEILDIDSSIGFGYSWDVFLDRISGREALLESSSMEAETVRAVLERLAEYARSKLSGTGPITGNDLANAYAAVTGQAAGEGVLAQLQRLPGLTERESEAGARSFVDADMLGALQGSAFARQVLAGFSSENAIPLSELSEKAVSMAIYLLQQKDGGVDLLIGCAHSLNERSRSSAIFNQAVADCCSVAIMLAINESRPVIDFRGLVVDGAEWGDIPLDEIDVRGLTVKNCNIRQMSLGRSAVESGLSFYSCDIGHMVGVANESGLPRNVISGDCKVATYEQMSTNSAILQMSISPQMKALITVLRKLYKQAGAGRKIAALSRGITRPDVLKYIEPVTHILAQHNFVSVYNNIVHPVRRQASRVEQILAAPSVSDDPVLKDVSQLS